MTLRELEPNTQFTHEKGHNKSVYRVLGKCVFNNGHGSSTRVCLNTKTNKTESKSCNLKVIVVPMKMPA